MQFNGVNKKSACVPLVVSGVDTCAHVLEFHMLVDHNVAYIQEAFSGIFVLWQLIAQAVPLPPFSLSPPTVSTV